MPTQPLATPDDVADIWRPLTDNETAQASRLIDKASGLLRQAVPFNIDERVTLAETDPENPLALPAVVVATKVAEIVKRVMVNRDGAATRTDTIGPYSTSVTFADRTRLTATGAPAESRSDLIITAQDIDALRPPPAFPAGGTIRTRPAHHPHPRVREW